MKKRETLHIDEDVTAPASVVDRIVERPRATVPKGRARLDIAQDVKRFQEAYGVYEHEDDGDDGC